MVPQRLQAVIVIRETDLAAYGKRSGILGIQEFRVVRSALSLKMDPKEIPVIFVSSIILLFTAIQHKGLVGLQDVFFFFIKYPAGTGDGVQEQEIVLAFSQGVISGIAVIMSDTTDGQGK